MDANDFTKALGADFYAGVPDSQLKALCTYLMSEYGIDPAHHVIAANEGNCVGLAAGYHMATGKVPVVYMQNSGEGNVVNPVASLTSRDVYGIPMMFVIGWRGEPGVKDEPQHAQQGRITNELLDVLEIEHFTVSVDTTIEELCEAVARFRPALEAGGSVAFVVRKGALTCDGKPDYGNDFTMTREEIVELVSAAAGDDPIVSTTGKASRELFEIREARGEGHGRDFLTVGSMGHASSIALGIASAKPETRVWCIDGDGAVLMHMGSMAVIGSCAPKNFVHIVVNNQAHETVGGMPTVAKGIDVPAVALACGYKKALSVADEAGLSAALAEVASAEGPILLEAKCSLGARADLGRPTTTPQQNKEAFMAHLANAR